MSLNRHDLVRNMNEASTILLHKKDYISFIDVLLKMGKLTQVDYERWRLGKVFCLENVISVNLPMINHMLLTFHKNCLNGNLRPSVTVYARWGKGPKKFLRFSKSGDPNIEKAYSTHFLKPKEGV